MWIAAITVLAFLVDSWPGFAWFVQADNEGYVEWLWPTDDKGYLYKFTFGEPSSYVYLNAGGANAYVMDTWSIIDIRISGSNYNLYQGGNFKSSYSHSDLSGGGIGLEQWDGGPSEYDWILVRKYADTDPTASVGAEEAYSPGTIASNVYDTSEVNAGWDLLGWDETLPSGTDITFEVRASDTPFLKDDATPAWQDASVLPTGRYQQWRATLTTTDSADTPILHEVWDLYSW